MVENDKSIKCTKFRKIYQNIDYVSMWCDIWLKTFFGVLIDIQLYHML